MAFRSPILTIFWRCGRMAFSSRKSPDTVSGNEPSTVLAEDSGVLKGLAMLIRSKLYGVRGGAAKSAPARPAASAPTLLLGELLLLIGP
jgi:hypothetical protein